MRNKIFLSVVVFATFTIGVFANQCPGDFDYNYKNGHRAVSSQYYYDWNTAKNVTVCSTGLPYSWKEGLKKAINSINSDLSSTTSSLRFSYINSPTCTVPVSYVGFSSSYADALALGANKMYGTSLVKINKDKPIPNIRKAQHILMHELLHTAGLGHTGITSYHEIPSIDGWYEDRYSKRSIMCQFTDPSSSPIIHLNDLDKESLEIMY